MSVKVTAIVWEHSKHKATKKLLLLAIADHASLDGVCWPGIERLAQYSGITNRHATNLIQELEESGELYVARNAGRGNTNLYYVTLCRSRDEITSTLIKRLGVPPEQAEHDAGQIIARQKGVVQFTFSDMVPQQEKMKPPAQKGEIPSEKVKSPAQKGEVASSPEPLEPSCEPSIEPSPAASAPEKTGEALLKEFIGPKPERTPPRANGKNYADPVQAGGADSVAEAIVDGICCYNNLPGGIDSLPKKKRKSWVRHIAEIIAQWGGATVEQAGLAWQAWTVEYAWKRSVNPFYSTFDTEIGPLLVGVREGSITVETLRQKAESANGGNGNGNSTGNWSTTARGSSPAARSNGKPRKGVWSAEEIAALNRQAAIELGELPA